MNKSKLIKGAGIVAITAILPLSSAMADGNWSISGWLNEGLTYVDDGVGSDVVQLTDNGTTLGSRITLAGSYDLPNSSLNAGFEVILEPQSAGSVLGFGTVVGNGGGISAYDSDNGDGIGVLGNSIHIGGSFGKLTLGLQSMPTDNIAVLEDPSLTLWSSIPAVFRGNGLVINSGGVGNAASNSTWGSFMSCYTNAGLRGGLGIGIDCNGTYLRGVRYDLPKFDLPGGGSVDVAVGYANDDVYDIAAKYKASLGRLNTQLAVGYAINQGGGADGANGWDEASNLQMQLGLMDSVTGIFGAFSYQNENVNLTGNLNRLDDSTNAYWLKVGVKRTYNSLGDTSFAFQYGSYNDQFDTAAAAAGVTGSEVERIGFEVNQYFGSRFILYGTYENLSLDVDGTGASVTNLNGADGLDTFTAGMTFFF